MMYADSTSNSSIFYGILYRLWSVFHRSGAAPAMQGAASLKLCLSIAPSGQVRAVVTGLSREQVRGTFTPRGATPVGLRREWLPGGVAFAPIHPMKGEFLVEVSTATGVTVLTRAFDPDTR